MPITIQTGANQFSATDITKYSLMMGGLNVTNPVLKQYDPLVSGYYRIFMVRKPKFVDEYFKTNGNTVSRFDAFRHILEYGNLGVSGIQGLDLQTSQVSGGYAGKSFEIPTVAQDGTNSLTIKVLEFSGSPIREVLHTWINGISDENSGFAHYNGLIASGDVGYSQANQTAEFIYVVTDRTGMKIEYACMFANCMPKSVPADHFNSSAGEHDKVELDIEFTATKYVGADVNEKARILLKKNQIMVNSLEFFTGLKSNEGRFATWQGYNPKSGQIEDVAGGKLGKDATETTYRTKISNTDANATTQKIDLEDISRPTPSYTDLANRVSSQ